MCDCAAQVFPGRGILCLFKLASEIEVVPANDAIFDEPVACLGDLLFLLFDLDEFTRVAHGDCAGEAVGEFDLVELALYGLAQG